MNTELVENEKWKKEDTIETWKSVYINAWSNNVYQTNELKYP